MDETDKIIVASLQEDGRVSLTDLGRKLGLSHVSIRKRLQKLSKDLLKVSAGLNAEKLGIYLAIVFAEVETPKRLQELIQIFSKCPRMIFLARITGAYNLMTIMIAENVETLNAIIEHCSVRAYKGIRRSEAIIAEAPIIPRYLPIKLVTDKSADDAPCGINCGKCIRYRQNKCLACPATKYYKGPL